MNISKYADVKIANSHKARETSSLSLVEKCRQDLFSIAKENKVNLTVKVKVMNSQLSLFQRFLQGLWVMLGFDTDLCFALDKNSISISYGRHKE